MEQYLLTQEDIDRLGITGVMAASLRQKMSFVHFSLRK